MIFMAEKINQLLIIAEEIDKKMCEYCGKIAETRPYGRNNEEICFECGMKPGNLDVSKKRFRERA